MIIERTEKKEKRYMPILVCLLTAVVIVTSASAYMHFIAKAANKSLETKITLLPGETYTLSNTGKKATYKSKNSKIASVSKKGKIKAKTVGKTTITIKSSSVKTKINIAVIGLNKTKTSLVMGDTIQLKVKHAFKSTRWYSTRPNIAKVSGKGLVTGISKGTATIKALTDGKILKCKVRVFEEEKNTELKENDAASGTLEVHFIDVGQADCIFLKEINENTVKNYLIDCGNADDKDTISNYLKEKNVSQLDGLFLTHWHDDHIGSAQAILNAFEVKKAYIRPNNTNVDTAVYKNTMKALQNVPCEYPKAGEYIDLGNIQIDVIGPCSDSIPDGDENKNSLAFILKYGNKKMFFGGDTPQENETEIINSGADLSDISVYKVSHHGSTYSTSYAFVRAMTERKSTNDPFYSIISVGEGNSYYHPHSATLQRLEQAGAKIYQTDLNGTVVFTTDGNSLDIQTEKSNSTDTIPTIAPTTSANDIAYAGKYIGNKNSKVVHIDTCTSLPAEQNRVYFDSYEQAVSEGFRPCGNCLREYSTANKK